MYKVVGNRYMEKRVNLRVEHVKHSKCRDDFLNRVKANAAAKTAAKAAGGSSGRIRFAGARADVVIILQSRSSSSDSLPLPEKHELSPPPTTSPKPLPLSLTVSLSRSSCFSRLIPFLSSTDTTI